MNAFLKLDSTLTGMTNNSVLVKGGIGIASPIASIWLSYLPQIEAVARISALILGCAVSIVTIWSLWYHRNDGKKGK